jgi:hypothetical protein
MNLTENITKVVTHIGSDIKDITNQIGNTSLLTTNEKLNLVSAINEIDKNTALNAGQNINILPNNIVATNNDVSFTSVSVSDISMNKSFVYMSKNTEKNIIASVLATVYSLIECTISVMHDLKFHSVKILAVHNGTHVTLTEYASVYTDFPLAIFDAEIIDGNFMLQANSYNINTQFKTHINAITI